ncbi:MAG TPA: DUF6468 domain-containing protein [Acetobacteraceae bacterium]|nr:DUF6468 domain-containing protein [Acetobacteraceae bacterium]
MDGMQWLLEIALMALLAATLFHALRLERALGVLKRDRAQLEALVKDFNASTREAEAGIERLRTAADTTGHDLARHTATAAALKDDLGFLIERAERMADRLDAGLRSGRGPEAAAGRAATAVPPAIPPSPVPLAPRTARAPTSEAERELLRALRMAR